MKRKIGWVYEFSGDVSNSEILANALWSVNVVKKESVMCLIHCFISQMKQYEHTVIWFKSKNSTSYQLSTSKDLIELKRDNATTLLSLKNEPGTKSFIEYTGEGSAAFRYMIKELLTYSVIKIPAG